MDSALYLGLTTRSALNRRMDVAAHNIANLNTTAFKSEKVVFQQHLVDLPNATATDGGKVSFVVDKGVRRNFEEGPLVHTGNPLDVFLSEGGFLSVETSNGETLYTRNGRMTINNARELTTLNGDPVLDDFGGKIVFNQDEGDIRISPDGTISSDTRFEVAKLGIATFSNPQALDRRGNSLYASKIEPQTPENATDVTVTAGAIEGSNVNPVASMVELMQISQAASKNKEVGTQYEDLRKEAIQRLGRVARF